MIVRLRRRAEADLEECHRWYEGQRPGLGKRLIDDFRATLSAVIEGPNRWPTHPFMPSFRRCRFKNFPLALAYRVDDDYCSIYAVEDLRRRPGYWRRRTR